MACLTGDYGGLQGLLGGAGLGQQSQSGAHREQMAQNMFMAQNLGSLRMAEMELERSRSYAPTRPINFKLKPDGIREELQAEVDDWLSDI